MAEIGKAAKLVVLTQLDAVDGAASGKRKPRKRKVKGHGVDRLRAAAERRVAESSEALAELLMKKALEGKLDSVKMLMKLAEEEKVRKEQVIEEDAPCLVDALIGSTARIGQVWDGERWKRLRKNRILEASEVEEVKAA
jgi:hypothetical protein